VTVLGDYNPKKLMTHFRGLEGLLKRRAGKEAIGAACRQIALVAADLSQTINRNLITVEMDSTGQTHCSYHSEDGAEAMVVPDTLSLQGGSTQATIHTIVSGDQVTIRIQAKVARNANV
jgi:hypothetical protein